MYFENFPKILYEIDDANGDPKAVYMTDITRNIRFRRDLLSNITVYDEYDIVSGETPERISEKVYGTSLYHWIIMLANERYDYRKDFPLTQLALDNFVSDKYGVENINGIHHYIDANGYRVHSGYPGAVSVSNIQYEDYINESKRRIKIIPKGTIDVIFNNFKKII